jgi:cell division protein FtsB
MEKLILLNYIFHQCFIFLYIFFKIDEIIFFVVPEINNF